MAHPKTVPLVPEAAAPARREAGGGEGGADQGVGHEQAARARAAEPAAAGTERPLQPAVGAAEEPHSRAGD